MYCSGLIHVQSDNVVLSSKIYFQYCILLKLKKRSRRWVHPYSVSLSGCQDVPFSRFWQGRTTFHVMQVCKQGWGQFLLELIHSIPIWLGCHLASCVILCCIFSTLVVTLQLYLIIYQSMTTIVSLLLFIILFLSVIVMYLHHYLHQVYSEGNCITPVIKFN